MRLKRRGVRAIVCRTKRFVDARLISLREVFGKLLESSAPPLLHRFMAGSEGLKLLRAGIDRRPVQGKLRFALAFGETDGRQNLHRPVRIERMVGRIAFGVGKRNNENQSVRRGDFPENPLAPHTFSVRQLHAVDECAIGSKVYCAIIEREAFRSPPVNEVLALGPRFEDLFA